MESSIKSDSWPKLSSCSKRNYSLSWILRDVQATGTKQMQPQCNIFTCTILHHPTHPNVNPCTIPIPWVVQCMLTDVLCNPRARTNGHSIPLPCLPHYPAVRFQDWYANLLFGQIFPKTAWKRRKLGREGVQNYYYYYYVYWKMVSCQNVRVHSHF